MKALLAALLFAFCLLCPCAHAQQDEAARSRFLAAEAEAKQGDAGAQFMLGGYYYFGDGVAKDVVEAYAWWNLASATDKDAAKYRDSMEKKMSPQQVADAQKRTRELRAMIEANAKAKAGK